MAKCNVMEGHRSLVFILSFYLNGCIDDEERRENNTKHFLRLDGLKNSSLIDSAVGAPPL